MYHFMALKVLFSICTWYKNSYNQKVVKFKVLILIKLSVQRMVQHKYTSTCAMTIR